VFVISHREPALRISRTHVVNQRRGTFSIDFTTDGQDVFVDRDDIQLHCRAYWDGQTLVFDTGLIRGGEEATNVVRYTLESGANTFRADERFRSASLNCDNLWVLDRVASG
jgi:cold shock CspA family protein